jgi:1-acyl-sn-glycerol-3-phosphate acyltransferase
LLDNPLTRRLITVTFVFFAVLIVTALLPVLVLVAATVDLVRWMTSRQQAMALRMLLFCWLYLVGEGWAILALAFLGLLPEPTSTKLTFRAQRAWLNWNFVALSTMFSLTFDVRGQDSVPPGPIVLLSRHASLIDTMLPGRFVVRPHGIKLRYVLKKELLIDPALDIGGNRLPNYFIDRSGNSHEELAALRELARSLQEDEGVLIYPEGTRYSDQKRIELSKRWEVVGGAPGAIAAGLRRVLPPRPGGTLAILDVTDADVVVLAHRGLEGFARMSDMWAGGIAGTTVDVSFWRVPRSSIPETEDARIEWLFRLWAEVDSWVVSGAVAAPPAG